MDYLWIRDNYHVIEMDEEVSMSASFRAMMRLHAYRELTGEEESFFELYPEYLLKKRVAQRIGARARDQGLEAEVLEIGEKIRAGGYAETSTVERLEEELETSRKTSGVVNKGVEKVLELASSWIADVIDRKEFTLSDLEQMHDKAPDRYKPMISESINYLTPGRAEVGSTTDPNIQRLIS
jgi:hypothetical protein